MSKPIILPASIEIREGPPCVCSECGKETARFLWEAEDVCSLCLLYRDPPVLSEARLDAFVQTVEEERGARYRRASKGRLYAVDADALLGTLVLTSRVFRQIDEAMP